MKIMLCAGHGLHTPGKQTPGGSMHEWEFNAATAQYVKDILVNYENVEVLFAHDPTGEVDIPLKKRTDYANQAGADVYVSIHANAAGATWNPAVGIETYVYKTNPASSRKLADVVQKKLIERTGRQNRGVKTADFHVLRETHMPAILCECGFMTNQAEATLLKSADYRIKCAGAIADGLIEVYGLKPKSKPVVASNVGTDAIPAKRPDKYRLAKLIDTDDLKLIDQLKKDGYRVIELPH
jgi:N-acetylmuramoyl-L-alanine amidase